ncbi:MAG: hypothetical protein AABW63_02055 [Nanoarchaeota archaeon]
MERSNIFKHAIINAFATSVYVATIATLMYLGGKGSFGTANDSVFIPISMLMLFVFSAALTGFLVFGRPVMWYLDGKKREALYLIIYTLGILMALTIVAFLFLITLKLL